ncbi:ATP-binding cassette domain-containing protein [Bacillus sp. FJAT-29790]|uniref:sugar ABC transporter ATP-binding protein n=1 Tax=Bacillus sp. FJAT-29790 TaxID=1895002 RepID=UPI001C22D8FE|nr:ATP-binding cassette domain-containing protein [Bacillus sp. FJAT-29790]MBU8879253.1 ATP-binding cassette domain-containing protein [Bacillus sp. FJAT-29790]
MDYMVKMEKITKEFSGIPALQDVDFNLLPGEVHVLLGENGAGKSTLMKILCGIYEPTEGSIIIQGNKFSKVTPKVAASNGIGIIYQELSVIDDLSIAENIFVGKIPTKKTFGISTVDYEYMKTTTTNLLERVGLNRRPDEIVGELSISEKQQVEIAKALAADTKVLVMDEPTSSLTDGEIEKLFEIIRQLKSEGVGIVYISHKLKEIKIIGDRITILKDGTFVATKDLATTEIDELITLMVGRELQSRYLTKNQSHSGKNEVVFEVKNLTRKDEKVKDISFQLKKGEILGFAGLIGSGRTELMNAIVGSDPMKTGEITLNGKSLNLKNPYDAVKNKIAYITENRRETGFFPNFGIWKNISISNLINDSKFGGLSGLVKKTQEMEWAEQQKKNLSIKCSSVHQNITELSGGNQQKVIIGRWLAAGSSLFIFDEPTRGIDVGAKSDIYKIMRDLADNGKGVLVVSSELPELLAICDRIAVFQEGKLNGILTSDEATEEKIMAKATS